jgi:hypothetical protein
MAFWITVLSTCVALQLSPPKGVLLADRKVDKVNDTKKVETEAVTKVEMTMVMGCGRKNPGAGMSPNEGFVTIYKDGYFHVRCMMDEMFKIANYHDELTRVHEYKVTTNVSIVKYADRVDIEKQQKMTPRTCFDFCRTIPEMNQFGLVYGRECYCTPYYHQIPGDGVCTSPCEGDNSITCGNQDGMADVYEMHTCGDTVQEAEADVEDMEKMLEHAHSLAVNASFILKGIDENVKTINIEEIRHPIMNQSIQLAALIRPLKEAIGKGEASSKHLSDYLATVSAGTTSAHQVLHIEMLQDHVNTAADLIKEYGDALEAWVDSMSAHAAFAAAGLEKTAVEDLGKSLQTYRQLFIMDPVPAADLDTLKSDMSCPGDSLMDCEKALMYYISYTGMRQCTEVGRNGYWSVNEYGQDVLGGMTWEQLQEENIVTCAAMCKDVESCHALYAYTSITDRKDDYESRHYMFCVFYTIPNTDDCVSNYHSISTNTPYFYGPESYYYSYMYYYFSYYYNSETGEGYGGGEMQTFSYYRNYEFSVWTGAHFLTKNQFEDCIGPVTYTNVDGMEVGF